MAEMAGQQQAVAANKALAATLGGRDAKWARWGAGGGEVGGALRRRDVVSAMERDPVYCRSALLYRLLNEAGA